MAFKVEYSGWFCLNWHIKPPASLYGYETDWDVYAFIKFLPWADMWLLFDVHKRHKFGIAM